MASRLRTRLRASTGLATPSLNIELATAAGGLDPRVTFSRGTQATLTDSTGKITYAPNNLLTNSESFEASSWLKSGATITSNSLAAPNGTSTADTLVEDTSTGDHIAYQTLTFVAGVNYIMTVYAKANTRTRLNIVCVTGLLVKANFDLSAGTVISTISGTASISDAGNGWYRCVLAGTATSTASGNMQLRLISSGTTTSYTGNGTSGLYIWGAQLEAVTYQTTPSPYVSTTPKNLLGYTQEFDNAAWTKSNSFVQTNLLTYSQDFDNATWAKGNGAVTANTVAAPNGTTTADSFVTTAATAATFVQQPFTSVASAYVASVYVRANGVQFVQLLWSSAQSTNYANFDLINGTVGGNSATAATITAVGGGWYRIAITSTLAASAGAFNVYCVPASSSARGASYTGDGTSGIYLWGAQLVQGSTAGDYQRTDAAAAAVQYTAPDGSLSADKLVASATTALHNINQDVNINSTSAFTYSVYAKSAEYTTGAIVMTGLTSPFPEIRATFNLSNETIATSGTGTVTASSITNVGNGWYRISLSGYTGQNGLTRFYIHPNTNASFTGDGTSGIYVWGAQLSNSASLDPYAYNPGAAPTSAAYYGPRFDYDPVTLAPKGLLIEEQRTNLLTYSEQFDNAAWVKGAATITANTAVAPSGAMAADTITEDTTNAGHTAESASVSFTSGVSYTLSVYAKAATGTRGVCLRFSSSAFPSASRTAFFSIASGTVVSNEAGTTASITNVGNGWYRCTMTATANATATISGAFIIMTDASNNRVYTGDGTGSLYIYGAQLEAGAFATSYIPTVASTVTRSVDVASMTGTNFASWHNPLEGTLYVEASIFGLGVTTASGIAALSNGTAAENIAIFRAGSSNNLTGEMRDNNVTQATYTVALGSQPIKAAFAYAANNSNFAVNGSVQTTDTACTVPTVDRLIIGSVYSAGDYPVNGHIRSIQYYPTRLTNTQLQVLTT